MSRLFKLAGRSQHIVPALVVLTLAAAGAAAVINGRAATLAESSEAEAGNVSVAAGKVSDTSASGGQSVRFGGGTTSPGNTCTNPVFTTTDTNGGWSNGGYYVHNNMWNASSGETLYACAYNNWYVTANYPNTTDVKTYPNVHLDINNMSGKPLSNYTTITSKFAGSSPHVGIYDVAYDVWLNGVGWGGGTTEYMIWTDNYRQVPLGSVGATIVFDGISYSAYHYNDGDANVISLVPSSPMNAGTLNLKAMFDWAISKGWMPANPTVNQIGYGVEVCSTNNTSQTFYFTDFAITMN
jgi:hypothetical protein